MESPYDERADRHHSYAIFDLQVKGFHAIIFPFTLGPVAIEW